MGGSKLSSERSPGISSRARKRNSLRAQSAILGFSTGDQAFRTAGSFLAAPRARLGWYCMKPKVSPAVSAVLRRLLDRLGQAGIFQEFYLAGGTGLALLIDHRRSVDLDFFSRKNRLDFEGRRRLLSRLRPIPGWNQVEAKNGTLHGRIGRVKVSFFWYDVPLLRPMIRQGALRIASLEDIGLMKIGAIIGRGSRKDFLDVYAVCQKIPLKRLLSKAGRKFKDSRDFTLQAMKALNFFEDAEQEPLLAGVAWGWPQVKGFFETQVRSLAKRELSA